ncbi:hypothetical protein [Streptomyces sp. NPDC094049]|uniref:hypothetical protein n=1 Tax=Streptomyces sp. NPDC094049 TaxID=3154987 RepID=UPI003320BAF8
MHRPLTGLAALALVLAAAAPTAANNIHFYVYQAFDSSHPDKAQVVNVVKEYPDPPDQLIGTCKNVHGTGDFANYTGRTVYLHARAGCEVSEQFPARRVKDRERVANTAFQSVRVEGTVTPPR